MRKSLDQQNNFYEVMRITEEEPEQEINYVKYTLNLMNMKHYQRVIFGYNNTSKWKGKISWNDKTGRKTMLLHDITKWVTIDNPIMNTILNVTNELGHYINISNISDSTDKIGNFRKIYNICEKNKDIFKKVYSNEDLSLIELLFFNKKHGIKLYTSTLTSAQINIKNLLENTASSAVRILSATATMTASSYNTPSQQIQYEQPINKDINICTICCSENREYIFSCGHCYACKDCAEIILDCNPKNKCSYCRKDIIWIRKLILSDDQMNINHYYKCISDDCFNIASIASVCGEEYHLALCKKCYSNKNKFKKSKKIFMCFCGKEICSIKENIFFN